MPIYEYICDACGHQLEALQKISDAPLVDCPECAKASLRKKVSAAAFRLKGGGWYETDFKSGNKKNLAGDNKPDSKTTESTNKGESSTEKKAESKSDKKESTSSKSNSTGSSGSNATGNKAAS